MVFSAYGRRSFDCGRSDVPLEVHHDDGNPMNDRTSNTIPLCLDCHHDATLPGV